MLDTAAFGVSGPTNILPVNFLDTGGGILFTFSNGQFTGTGRFAIFVPVNLHPGDTNVPVYESIFFTSVNPAFPTPEPATLTLLGTGLAWRRESGGGAMHAKKDRDSVQLDRLPRAGV
ncbi:MAG TPA: PEP-CTERM sorting domain-containing protein [Pyrinomonadaceae bacterium]|jgi:hypothetical protein|nr:PEP-CTERM sorting domain-containing protein [Pyrinomonadaceae bacterium]